MPAANFDLLMSRRWVAVVSYAKLTAANSDWTDSSNWSLGGSGLRLVKITHNPPGPHSLKLKFMPSVRGDEGPALETVLEGKLPSAHIHAHTHTWGCFNTVTEVWSVFTCVCVCVKHCRLSHHGDNLAIFPIKTIIKCLRPQKKTEKKRTIKRRGGGGALTENTKLQNSRIKKISWLPACSVGTEAVQQGAVDTHATEADWAAAVRTRRRRRAPPGGSRETTGSGSQRGWRGLR